MDIILYHSHLCPRCHMAKKNLAQIVATRDDLSLKEVDILKEPLRAWRDGVRMIPAIRAEEQYKSAIFLSKKAIEQFLGNLESKR